MKNWLAYIEVAVVAVVTALLLNMFVVDAIHVPSASMEPTILPGDAIFVNKLSHNTHNSHQTRAGFSLFHFLGMHNIERGDVVAFKFPSNQSLQRNTTTFVKRCVGIAGDTVVIQNGNLYLNGTFIHRYTTIMCEDMDAPENFGPVVVPDNDVFVLGDNFNHSYDSRAWGFVPEENIIGKATLVYWSRNPSNENTFSSVRWKRIGTFVR